MDVMVTLKTISDIAPRETEARLEFFEAALALRRDGKPLSDIVALLGVKT